MKRLIFFLFLVLFLNKNKALAQDKYLLESIIKKLEIINYKALNQKEIKKFQIQIFELIQYQFKKNNVVEIPQIIQVLLDCFKENLTNKQRILFEAYTYEIIGIFVTREQEDYPLALYYLQKALAIYQEIPKEYPEGLCYIYNDLALCAYLMQDYPQAMNYASLLKSHSEALQDSLSMARYWKITGLIHLEQGNYTQARIYLEKSLVYNQYKKKLTPYADDLNNLAEVYQKQKRYLIADSLLHQALRIFEFNKIPNDMPYLYETYNDIGELLAEQGKHQEAIYYSLKADSIRIRSKGLHADHFKEKIMRNLYLSYKSIGHYQEALKAMEQVDTLQGKLYGVEREKYKRLMDLRIDTETSEHRKEAAYQRVIALTAGGVALMVAVLAVVLWLNNRQKQRTNLKLQLQKEEISKAKDIIEQKNDALQIANASLDEQKKEVENKNEEIEDSIIYAKRIQDAILPFQDRIARSLEEFFILFRPRDIVSGDFYYFNPKEHKIIFAAVDCTGHGVPGAFMSMIGSEILNEIVNNKHITEADLILNELNKDIKLAFRDGSEEIKDGMNIALLSIDKKNNLVEFAGSKFPLIYIQNNELKVIKGDIHYIGGERSSIENAFTKHIIPLTSQPTIFYIFSDGYPDQFGGPLKKKYMISRLRNFLLSIHHLPLKEQQSRLAQELDEWQGNLKQIDDILVMGVRL